MKPIFNKEGKTVAWMLKHNIHQLKGKHIAVIDSGNIYNHNGKHLGVYDDGIFRDHDGNIVAFTPRASENPLLPTPEKSPFPPIPSIPPIKVSSTNIPAPSEAKQEWGLDWKSFIKQT